MKDPIVILGGGPCGLSCAWELAAQGWNVVVLEREPHPGGLCATNTFGEYRFDLGGHRFLSQNQELTRRILDLMGDDMLIPERKSVVMHSGKRFSYPLSAPDLVENLGLGLNLKALLGYAGELIRRRIAPRDESHFEGWVTARFGRPLYDRFFGPYTEKLWGISPTQISSDWAAQRISLLNLGDAALRLAGLRQSPIRTYARRYYYPRLGMGQLFDRMAGKMCDEGGVIHLGADVTGLEVVGKRVKAVRYRLDGQEHLLPCSWVFSTISLPALVRYIAPHSTNGVGTAIGNLRSRALRFLNIPLDIPDFSENTWMYVAEPQYKMSRIQEPKRRSPAMAPPGKTSIMLEIPCSVGDRIWDADGDTLFREMSIELRSLGFDIDAIAMGHHSVWVEHGYPIYHLGYQHDRDTLLREVAKMDNVLTGGRQGIFRYIFLDTAMEMGIEAAHQIMQNTRNLKHIGSIRMEKELLEVNALTAT